MAVRLESSQGAVAGEASLVFGDPGEASLVFGDPSSGTKGLDERVCCGDGV